MRAWVWLLSGAAIGFTTLIAIGTYQVILDRLDDQELAKIARARADEKGVPVDIDSL